MKTITVKSEIKKILIPLVSVVLSAFGLLTLVLSSGLIFDLFGIRAKQGNYVLFVAWANFIVGFFYLFAVYGFLKAKKWTIPLLGISTIVLIFTFMGLIIHINSGGIYEARTIGALIFRIFLTLLFIVTYLHLNKGQ
ncbi:MAG: hypothetical protein M0P66_07090 [Salinivirgaceae bacterium]|nr:hypothetical protein [Salinivirgaceae bacterium]